MLIPLPGNGEDIPADFEFINRVFNHSRQSIVIKSRSFSKLQNKKTGSPFSNPAILARPVAFRPCLSAGLAFSKRILKNT